MTKFAAAALDYLVQIFLLLLPGRRRAAVHARLYARLKPFMTTEVAGHRLRLIVPDRHSLYWINHAPNAELDTNAWVKSFAPDDVFVDVGANIGFYSLLAAAHGVRQIYAFEANPLSYGALVQNVFANHVESQVVALNVALSDRSEMVTFGMSSLDVGTVGNEIGHGAYDMRMLAMSLDDFIRIADIPAVHHLKIDVDGIEAAILAGATALLSSDHLKSLLVEINDGNKEQRGWILDFLREKGWEEVPPPAIGKGNNQFFRRR